VSIEHNPQQPVERVVVVAGQEAGDACLHLASVEQNHTGNVERDQRGRDWSAHPIDAEATQHEGYSGGEETPGTRYSRAVTRKPPLSSAGYAWFGQTSSSAVVPSLGFRPDKSLYHLSPVNWYT
jgi:hypothetical protein